jgi:integrase
MTVAVPEPVDLLQIDMERLPFVIWVGNGKGGKRWPYFRTKETGRIPLKGAEGSPEFEESYAAALALRAGRRIAEAANKPDESSFKWLIGKYLVSAEYKALADSTQLDYSKTCSLLEQELGDKPFRYTTRAMLKAVRDDYAATPRKAHKVKQMLSRLYSWADEADLVPAGFNPAGGVKRLKRKGGEREIVPWSDPEIDWILAAAPAHLVTPVLLALYTGQRRRDVRAMTWQQWQGDLIRVRTSKTHELLELPCHPVLAAHLEELRRTSKVVSLTGPICLGEDGLPWPSDNALSGALRRVVEKHESVPDNRSFHGLRYAAAGRMEEGGATLGMLELVLGHRTLKMALKYASRRLRAKVAAQAMKEEA